MGFVFLQVAELKLLTPEPGAGMQTSPNQQLHPGKQPRASQEGEPVYSGGALPQNQATALFPPGADGVTRTGAILPVLTYSASCSL